MSDYLRLPMGEHAPEIVNAVIEIPLGHSNKYEYDKQLHVFRLDRNLHSPVHYPGDYGFIPSTLSEDGDPLDILVLADDGTFPGCLVAVRPFGILDMLDQGVLDRKVVGVAVNNPRFREIRNYDDVFPHLLREIEHFFSIYKDLEGKRTQMQGWTDAEGAKRAIVEAGERFRAQKAA